MPRLQHAVMMRMMKTEKRQIWKVLIVSFCGLDVLPDRPSHSAVFSEYEESGLLETDEVRSQRCLTLAIIRPTPA